MLEPRLVLTSGSTCVWRSPGVLQIGVDSGVRACLPAPPHADAVLRDLATPVTLSTLLRRHPGVPQDWIEGALTALRRAGLVGAPEPVCVDVWVEGAGPVATAFRRLLQAGEGAPSGAGSAALVVVAPATIEADRHLLQRLVDRGRPHLVVRASAEGATVGPLVVPGLSPCLRCTDLVRRDADRSWPALLAQLTQRLGRPEPAHAAWATGVAAASALAWLRHEASDLAGATLHLTRDHQTQRRPWPRHPDCLCVSVSPRRTSSTPSP